MSRFLGIDFSGDYQMWGTRCSRITLPGLPDAPPGPANGVLAALSGPAVAAGFPAPGRSAAGAGPGGPRAARGHWRRLDSADLIPLVRAGVWVWRRRARRAAGGAGQ